MGLDIEKNQFARLFHPRSVAVVGASDNPDSPGYDYVKSLRVFNFSGSVYPIHPRAESIAGYKVFKSLTDISEPIDLLISCISAEQVPALIKESMEHDIPFLHLFTGKLSETGSTNAKMLEEQILQLAKSAHIRLLGPNGMGIHYAASGLSFRPDLPNFQGDIGLLSQSGNNAVELLTRGTARGLKFGKVVSYGNGSDISAAELLEYLGTDRQTNIIAIYMEGLAAGREFFKALKVAAAKKPVVIHKGGRTASGASAAASHTAALAGENAVWESVIRQGGGYVTKTRDETLDLLIALSLLSPIKGKRAAVVGGGRTVQAADCCEENQIKLPKLPNEVNKIIDERAPSLTNWINNPVDQSILAGSGFSSHGLLSLMLKSTTYDFGIANVGEEWFLGRPDAKKRLKHACIRLIETIKDSTLPVAVIYGATETVQNDQRILLDEMRELLVAENLAVFPTIERATFTIGQLLTTSKLSK